MTDTDWKIEWATVYANAKDVAHAKREGKNLSIGDVVWRRARAVGPLTVDHNHWTGWVLDCDEADVLLAASAPRLKAENERLVQEVERLRQEKEQLRLENERLRLRAVRNQIFQDLNVLADAIQRETDS